MLLYVLVLRFVINYYIFCYLYYIWVYLSFLFKYDMMIIYLIDNFVEGKRRVGNMVIYGDEIVFKKFFIFKGVSCVEGEEVL